MQDQARAPEVKNDCPEDTIVTPEMGPGLEVHRGPNGLQIILEHNHLWNPAVNGILHQDANPV